MALAFVLGSNLVTCYSAIDVADSCFIFAYLTNLSTQMAWLSCVERWLMCLHTSLMFVTYRGGDTYSRRMLQLWQCCLGSRTLDCREDPSQRSRCQGDQHDDQGVGSHRMHFSPVRMVKSTFSKKKVTNKMNSELGQGYSSNKLNLSN